MHIEAKRFTKDVRTRLAINETPKEWSSIDVLRNHFGTDIIRAAFKKSSIGTRFDSNIRPHLEEDLAERATQIFESVLALSNWRKEQRESGLQIPDAGLIQGWVLQLIRPDELPEFVPPAFAEWAERLTGAPVPHIVQANEWIAQIVAKHLSQDKITTIKAADLGAGTGSTIKALEEALNQYNIEAEIVGVDLTPKLAQIARERTGRKIIEGNAIDWLGRQEDGSLDVITMVYAIHHLHYQDQQKLRELAFRKLKNKGLFVIADPTGLSKFNLENLYINEPEAVIACFEPSVVELANKLQKVGFSIPYMDKEQVVDTYGVMSTEQGNILDQGTLGYTIVTVKA